MTTTPEHHRALGRRIEQALREGGKTQVSLAEYCGVTPQAVTKWVKSGKIGRDNLSRTAEYLNRSVHWLTTGRDDVLRVGESPGNYGHRSAPILSEDQARDWRTHLDRPGLLHRPLPPTAGTAAFWMKNQGDSMANPYGQPSVPVEAMLLVDPELPAENGRMVIAEIEGKVTFKKYVEDAGRVYLVPLNPRYEAVPAPDSIAIIGVVTRYEMDL